MNMSLFSFIANFQLTMSMKELWKSVNI